SCRHEAPICLRISGERSDPAPAEIVGVVGDIRHDGLTADPRPTVFLAQAQGPGYITYLVVRTAAALSPLLFALFALAASTSQERFGDLSGQVDGKHFAVTCDLSGGSCVS